MGFRYARPAHLGTTLPEEWQRHAGHAKQASLTPFPLRFCQLPCSISDRGSSTSGLSCASRSRVSCAQAVSNPKRERSVASAATVIGLPHTLLGSLAAQFRAPVDPPRSLILHGS